jgi:hypothetical protein
VPAVDVGQPIGDVRHRLVPADRFECAVGDTAQRGGHPIGVVDHFGERDALLTGETCRQRVILIGPQGHQPAVLDGGNHAAQRLADPAERRLLLDGHAVIR